MTTNAFIFMWDNTGIEAIVPISQYEEWDQRNCWNVLTDAPIERNPLTSILQSLLIRARANSHRRYEIYTVDCELELDKIFWQNEWDNHPQSCADLIRERGNKLFCNSNDCSKDVII